MQIEIGIELTALIRSLSIPTTWNRSSHNFKSEFYWCESLMIGFLSIFTYECMHQVGDVER